MLTTGTRLGSGSANGASALATTESPPTLTGVGAAVDQHLGALRRLASRAKTIADHLAGAQPGAPDAAVGQPSNGAVRAIHEGLMDAASLGEAISFSLQRIESVIGVVTPDDGMPTDASYRTGR